MLQSSRLPAKKTINNVTAALTFEEAFAVRKSNAGALCAVSAYREVAARLSVIAAIGGSHETRVSITKELREAVSYQTAAGDFYPIHSYNPNFWSFNLVYVGVGNNG